MAQINVKSVIDDEAKLKLAELGAIVELGDVSGFTVVVPVDVVGSGCG